MLHKYATTCYHFHLPNTSKNMWADRKYTGHSLIFLKRKNHNRSYPLYKVHSFQFTFTIICCKVCRKIYTLHKIGLERKKVDVICWKIMLVGLHEGLHACTHAVIFPPFCLLFGNKRVRTVLGVTHCLSAIFSFPPLWIKKLFCFLSETFKVKRSSLIWVTCLLYIVYFFRKGTFCREVCYGEQFWNDWAINMSRDIIKTENWQVKRSEQLWYFFIRSYETMMGKLDREITEMIVMICQKQPIIIN